MKRLCSVLCVAALLVGMPTVYAQGTGEEPLPATVADTSSEATIVGTPSYFTYKNDVARKTVSPAETVTLSVEGSSSVASMQTVAERSAVLLDETGEQIAWQITLSAPAIFELTLEYQPYGEQHADASVGIWLDGTLPYTEANQLQLESVWHNEGFCIETDEKGDHMRPTQVRQNGWHTMMLKDAYGDAVQLYLEAGEHTVAVSNEDYGLYVHGLTLSAPTTVPTYKEYAQLMTEGGANYFQIYEGELADYKSDSMLYPIYDRSSPVTQPYSVENILLNTIGGGNWSKPGQWIDWKLEVPEDGWYTVGMRVRQNTARGLYAYRNLYIDGKPCFAEMKEYAFSYDSSWQLIELGGEEPYRFYLTAGSHTLRMEATCGPMEYTHGVLSRCLTELNTLYRQIIMITGTTPDALRDYSLNQEIPGLTNTLLNMASTLRDEVDRVERTTGINGSELTTLIQFANLLERMQASPDTIPSRLSVFKSNISSLAQLLTTLVNSPLEVDYIYLAKGEYKKPAADATFWQMLKHLFKQFLYSFVGDYSDNMVAGQGEGEPMDVWIMMGRDQAQIIKNMIQDEFTPQTGLYANLSVVNLNLSQAIMAGEGPDVVVGMGHDQPVELGVRGALLPLEEMDGFDGVMAQFRDGSANAYTYGKHTYAIPETQDFMVLFARTDIFDELGLEIPQTWEEMRSTIVKIVQENLEVGLPASLIGTLLLQNELSYFDDELNLALNGGEEIPVYEEFISFFREYNCEAYYDAVNRFRTGEMPLLMANYVGANALSIQAPEIRNLWTIMPIPGTAKKQADGTVTINRSMDMSGSCNVITRNTKNKENAWRFIKWWSSADSQSRFANELEMQMGESARYSTANLEAFNTLAWALDQKNVILRQGEWGKVIPQPPGNYLLARNLNNMFVTLYSSNANIRKTVQKYTADVNKELVRKREEFAALGKS